MEEALASPAIVLAQLTRRILCESVALPGDFHYATDEEFTLKEKRMLRRSKRIYLIY